MIRLCRGLAAGEFQIAAVLARFDRCAGVGRGVFVDPVQVRRHIGLVFQDARLFPHRRVRDNLKLFEAEGGLLTSTEVTGSQWDAPFGWAPLQMIAARWLLARLLLPAVA